MGSVVTGIISGLTAALVADVQQVVIDLSGVGIAVAGVTLSIMLIKWLQATFGGRR